MQPLSGFFALITAILGHAAEGEEWIDCQNGRMQSPDRGTESIPLPCPALIITLPTASSDGRP